MAGPLAGIRVLDLSRQLAAPWATQMLGDMGAEVIKVERPKVGDEVRSFGPPFIRDRDGKETSEVSFFFATNRNKQSITVDYARPEGQSVIKRLAARCDIVIENYRVGTMARYGLGYEQLSAVRPDLIYCSVTGFGQSGPYKDQAGYDKIFQAMGGLASITGYPEGEPGAGPLLSGTATVDIMTGMYTIIAILGALHHRSTSGEGQYIDMAMLDVAVAQLTIENTRYLLHGEVPQAMGNTARIQTPAQVFKCSDGHLVISVGNDSQFEKFSAILGRPELARDPRFTTNALRRQHRSELIPILDAIFLTRPVKHWVDAVASLGVPCAPINNIKQVFEDPQVQHRGMRVEVEHEQIGKVGLVANPIRYLKTPIEYRLAPPLLGQHTRRVLSDLIAMDASEFERLSEQGVI